MILMMNDLYFQRIKVDKLFKLAMRYLNADDKHFVRQCGRIVPYETERFWLVYSSERQPDNVVKFKADVMSEQKLIAMCQYYFLDFTHTTFRQHHQHVSMSDDVIITFTFWRLT